MKHFLKAVLCLLPVLFSACSPKGMTLAAVGYYLPEQPLPAEQKFDTYTLFLACSSDQNIPEYERLSTEFGDFADRIGEKNAAIWLREENIPGLSVSKGSELIRRYKVAYGDDLTPLHGPFVIVSDLHPREWPASAATRHQSGLPIAISFRDRSPPGISAVLKCLRGCVSSSAVDGSLTARVFQCNHCPIVVVPKAMDEDEPE